MQTIAKHLSTPDFKSLPVNKFRVVSYIKDIADDKWWADLPPGLTFMVCTSGMLSRSSIKEIEGALHKMFLSGNKSAAIRILEPKDREFLDLDNQDTMVQELYDTSGTSNAILKIRGKITDPVLILDIVATNIYGLDHIFRKYIREINYTADRQEEPRRLPPVSAADACLLLNSLRVVRLSRIAGSLDKINKWIERISVKAVSVPPRPLVGINEPSTMRFGSLVYHPVGAIHAHVLPFDSDQSGTKLMEDDIRELISVLYDKDEDEADCEECRSKKGMTIGQMVIGGNNTIG